MTDSGDGFPGRLASSPWANRGLLALTGCILCLLVMPIRGVITASLGPVVLEPIPALVALTGLLSGPVAVVGSVVGFLAYQVVQGILPIWEAVGYLTLGILMHVLRGNSDFARSRTPPQLQSPTGVREFLVVASVGALGAATVSAWGHHAFGALPFFPTALFIAISQFTSVLVGGGLVLGVVPRVVGEDRWWTSLELVRPSHGSWVRDSPSFAVVTVKILFAWFVLGSATTAAFQTAELIPPYYFRLYGLELLLPLTSSGVLERTEFALQVLFGISSVVLWAFAVSRSDALDRTRSDNSGPVHGGRRNK